MNIFKEDNYFIIEHIYDDGRSNARLNLPFNSAYLDVIEDNVVLIRSAKNNDVICTTTLDNLTINDEAVSLETLFEDFDAVATAAGGSGPAGPDWFTVTNLTDDENTFTFGSIPGFNFDYSLDGENWTNTNRSFINIPENGFVYIRNGNFTKGSSYGGMGINCAKNWKVSGNAYHLSEKVMGTPNLCNLFYNSQTLLDASELILPWTTLVSNCYREMFYGCKNLIAGPASLPATTLNNYCYLGMFQGCSSLTTAPELPATTLANTQSCYSRMFKDCTSLTTAPELPATTLQPSCYNSMFSGCSSLNHIKCLATSISAYWALDNWTNGVSAIGTFEKAAGVNWPTGISGIPDGWTVIEV